MDRLLIVQEIELYFEMKINVIFSTFWIDAILISFLSFKDISTHRSRTIVPFMNSLFLLALIDASKSPTKVDRHINNSLNNLSA
jgi:hypothetical protein